MPSRKQPPPKTFKSAIDYFRAHNFDIQEMPGTAGQMQIRKYDCGVVLSRKDDGSVTYVVRPGCLIGGEIATLVDRGFQKFFTTERAQIAATADRLKALHQFQEEVWEATGRPDYYNLALGTISDVYLYDRLKGREPESPSAVESH